MTTLPLQAPATSSAYIQRLMQAVADGFRHHAFLYLLAAFAYAAGVIECLWIGLPISFDLVSRLTVVIVFCSILFGAIWLGGHAVKLWYTRYDGSLRKALTHKLAYDIAAPVRVANVFHVLLINTIFYVGFVTIKKAIPHLMGGFPWDQSLSHFDRALHFGFLPHEWLLPLFGSKEALFALNFLYNFWFVIILFVWFRFGFSKEFSGLRMRFMHAYFLSWVIGTLILGNLFASAGPCYFGNVVTGDNPYAPLIAHLRAVNEIYPIWAVPTQDALWESYMRGVGQVEGISAMPSLHVGTAVLFALLAWSWGKRWAIIFTIPFAFAIFFGSILLGWHYAVDGYVGTAIAFACWWFSGKFETPKAGQVSSAGPR